MLPRQPAADQNKGSLTTDIRTIGMYESPKPSESSEMAVCSGRKPGTSFFLKGDQKTTVLSLVGKGRLFRDILPKGWFHKQRLRKVTIGYIKVSQHHIISLQESQRSQS
jgi:hypothetical protein